MNELVQRFSAVAEELTGDIAQSHRMLEGTDWQGTSRENALAMKAELQSQVDRVLVSATESLAMERDAFHLRADALVASVRNEFGGVMANVQVEYGALAAAARTTRENLLAADQTIRLS